MKSKEYVILGIIIVLLGVYLLMRNGNRAQYQLPALQETAGKDISRIEITSTGKSLDLSRNGDRWLVGENKYPADTSKVKDMLSVLEGLKLTALVSESKAYSRYDLTDEKKIGVKAWAGDRLVRDFDIGKVAETYQHTFVRLADDPNVYHAEKNFRQSFDQTVETMRDKTALSFATSDITGIDIVYKDQHYLFTLEKQPAEKTSSQEASSEKEKRPAGKSPSQEASQEKEAKTPEPVWKGENGAQADTESVQRLLSQLAYLKCSGYLEGRKKEDFTAPTCTITLKGKQSYSLSIFEKEGSDKAYPAVSSQNDYPFTLSETVYKRMTETLEKILGIKAAT